MSNSLTRGGMSTRTRQRISNQPSNKKLKKKKKTAFSWVHMWMGTKSNFRLGRVPKSNFVIHTQHAFIRVRACVCVCIMDIFLCIYIHMYMCTCRCACAFRYVLHFISVLFTKFSLLNNFFLSPNYCYRCCYCSCC